MIVKTQPEPAALLKQIAQIQVMERGKLCRMRGNPAGAYYNHQTWENGRNVVRYVPRDQIGHLKKAIAGYQRYLKLTKAYAEMVVRRTRHRQTASFSIRIAQKGRNPNKSGN
jgi:hypothetical protein